MFWKRFFTVLGILIILVFLAQLLFAPYVKSLMIKAAKESLGADVTIGDCALSVLRRTLILEDVAVLNPQNKDDYFLKAKEISVNFYLVPFLFNKYILQNISIVNPEAILYLDESGKLKLPQIKKNDNTTGPKGNKGILFKKLMISNGDFKFIDQQVSKPATITQFSSINCVVVNSVSLSDGTVITSLNATARIEGRGRFSVDGKIKLLEKPVSFNGDIKIEDVPLTEFSAYYGNSIPVIVKKGNLFIDTNAFCDKGSLDIKSKIRIEDVDLEPIGDPSQTVFFELKTIDVINFLKDENNTVKFGFEISGDLRNPDFKWGPEMMKALRNSVLKAFTDGVIRLIKTPAKAGEAIGNLIGGEAGEAAKKLGIQLEKIMGK